MENQLVYIDDRKIFEASYSRIDVTATEADIWRHFLQMAGALKTRLETILQEMLARRPFEKVSRVWLHSLAR